MDKKSIQSYYEEHKPLAALTLGFFIFTLLIFGGGLLYLNQKLQADYNQKLFSLSQKTADALASTKNALSGQLDALNRTLSEDVGSLDSRLKSFQEQNKKEITTLNGLIKAIEEQSTIQFGELKDDLQSVQVSGGDFSGIVGKVLESAVSISSNIGQGSGAIITDDGYIVTNFHVIQGAAASTIRAETNDGRTRSALMIGYDEGADIAVLKIEGNFKALAYGNSRDAKVGQNVIALGNPAGLDFSVTEGIISAFRETSNGITYLQIDVPINPGNSGGPLVNAKGEIIGINNFKLRGDFEGLGFAINSNTVEDITDEIISKHRSLVASA